MKKILILTLAIAVSGCASTSTNKNISQLKAEGKGIIITETSSVFDNFIPLGQKLNLKIKSIDNVSLESSVLDGYPTEVEATEGEHTLLLYCDGYIDGQAFYDKDDLKVSLTVESGSKYLLKPTINKSGGCSADIEDVTNK